jgi:zinc transporter ZupT
MPSINDYKAPFMIKMHLIIFTALCVFIGILYKCTRDLINNVLTWLIRLNIGVLFFAIDNVFIQGLLLLSTITTPYVIASDSGILLRSSFINKDLWVILTGIILFVYYNSDIDFVVNTTLFMILLAIIIPTMFHFINNKYLETRVMLLCLCIIFDIFNHNKDVLTTITDNV